MIESSRDQFSLVLSDQDFSFNQYAFYHFTILPTWTCDCIFTEYKIIKVGRMKSWKLWIFKTKNWVFCTKKQRRHSCQDVHLYCHTCYHQISSIILNKKLFSSKWKIDQLLLITNAQCNNVLTRPILHEKGVKLK